MAGVDPEASVGKEEILRHSVSFILPVRDMQYDLRERVHTILEVLAELTDAFDVLIVDYGSRDETRDVALELEREYPQVRVLDRADCRESLEAMEAGIPATAGEIVFVHDASTPFSPGAVRRLWQIRDDEELVMAQSRVNRAVAAIGRNVAHHSMAAPAATRDRAGEATSVQMLRRQAINELRPKTPEKDYAVDRVTRNDLLQPQAEADSLPRLLQRLRRLTSR